MVCICNSSLIKATKVLTKGVPRIKWSNHKEAKYNLFSIAGEVQNEKNAQKNPKKTLLQKQ